MPSLKETSNAPADELDDLFNYDVDESDPFRPFDTNSNTASAPKQQENTPKADLGIDEEIKPIRKREPIPKLDQDRLLSQKGIPKLRKITKSRLRLKGKGHEFSDVGRLLALYQLWLDDLYPRAKFADGLAIIEKLGHSKRMQTMRREWINEGKSRSLGGGDSGSRDRGADVDMPTPKASDRRKPEETHTEGREGGPEMPRQDGTGEEQTLFVGDNEPEPSEGEPSEDDLDRLLAEDTARDSAAAGQSIGKGARIQAPIEDGPEDDFAAEMEVMAEMGW